jgi:endonuclease III
MAERSTRETLGLIVDVVMMVLIIINLTLIIVDWGFASPFVQSQMQAHVPALYTWYDQTIHQHFLVYDLAFVTVFVIEILVRWGLAIYRQRYHRWFFYPFVHWYDVLGCIPVGSLRSLRLLRLIAMVPKLQRTGLVDLRETYLYETFEKYRDIALEEISDRVTVRIIEGLQNEIQTNQKVTTRIGKEVIAPQREALIEAVTHRLQEATAVAYESQQDDFHEYLDGVIEKAVARNREINTIASLPGVGRPVADLLERAISDIVFNVVDQMVRDVCSLDNDEAIAQVTSVSADALMSPKYDQRFNQLAQSLVLQSLDVIKDHVEIKQWKQNESFAMSPDGSSAAS